MVPGKIRTILKKETLIVDLLRILRCNNKKLMNQNFYTNFMKLLESWSICMKVAKCICIMFLYIPSLIFYRLPLYTVRI